MRHLLALFLLTSLALAVETYRDPKATAFYAEHKDFFLFAQPADLPKDLRWQDGSAQKEFADERALRGGTLRQFTAATPPTLRRVGPNANNGFRGELYDNNDFGLLSAHPETEEPIPALATSWALSADGLTAYFRLDPQATCILGAESVGRRASECGPIHADPIPPPVPNPAMAAMNR